MYLFLLQAGDSEASVVYLFILQAGNSEANVFRISPFYRRGRVKPVCCVSLTGIIEEWSQCIVYLFLLQAWESEASVLCINGEDDGSLDYKTNERFLELVPEDQKHRFQMINYPRAGHLIEPPYTPHCRYSFHKVFRKSWSKKHLYCMKLICSWFWYETLKTFLYAF